MEPIVLFEGYSHIKNGCYYANCSCVLIKGPPRIIIDTMTAWDDKKLVEALREHSVESEDIEYVISSHGHSDHTGCNHLFKNATHIVGYSVSHKDRFFTEINLSKGDEYIINDHIKVMATPGHTLQDVSVIVSTKTGVTAITGDLFEKFEDLLDDSIWKGAGSDNEELQLKNRNRILGMADFIIPGHGAMFKVPDVYKELNMN